MLSSLLLFGADDAGVKSRPLNVPGAGRPGFLLLPADKTGITFTNELSQEAMLANQNLLNGAGLALGDYDGDGWCDIFLCNLNGSSRLYRNLGGWKFQDVTEAAGLANSNLLARGAAFADINGDGFLDLVVTYSGKGARLFLNDGSGHFRDAQAKELEDSTGSMSIALGDVDGDGSLDLYVANYGENTIRTGMRITTRVVGGKEQVVGRYRNRLKIIEGHLIEYGEPDALYLNDGKGGFHKMSWTDGTFLDETGAALSAAPWDLGLSVVMHDLDQDGRPDLYVCNDFQDPDRIWLGDGRGHFRAIARDALRSIPHFSMACDFADINGDGLDDFIVTDMQSRSHVLRMRQISPDSPIPAYTRERAWDRPQIRRNFLFVNRGDGTYADIANYAGVAASDWSWSVVFLDVGLDGRPDVLIGAGHFYDTLDMDAMDQDKSLKAKDPLDNRRALSLFPPLRIPNVAFHNRGDFTFEETGHAWGFDSLQVSHSIGLADLDNDGDLDVVVNCLNDQALVYRNECSAPRVAVRLKGAPPNTQGIGARIKLLGGAVPEQSLEMTCG
ncbi:MAG TPA: VCBS repeat-containing protein, partial [Candidatus Limnocylindrales bacterium]|nr:VCBS repeat-containing protein [Candidatus Limnocylindrales bacterium]